MSAATLHCRYRLDLGSFRLDADLELEAVGVTGLYGPSGSGKTTLLRCLAGLEPAATGEFAIGGVDWDRSGFRLPAHRRGCGFVFQDARLFEHLSVAGNLEYGARRRGTALTSKSRSAVLGLLGIAHLVDRSPRQLSGGERRRVAIARALASGPSLLLLDEPLDGLDPRRRERIVPMLGRLHETMPVPLVFVSHRQEEVERLCDRLVVFDDGRVTAQGPIDAVLCSAGVPGLETGAIVAATVVAYDNDDRLAELRFDGGRLFATGERLETGNTVRVVVRARDVSLCLEKPAGTSILNVLPATVQALDDDGGRVTARLACGDTALLAYVTRRSARELGLAPGQRLFAQIKSVAVRAAPHASETDEER